MAATTRSTLTSLLLPFWVLWLSLTGLVFGVTKIAEAGATDDTQRLQTAFGSNLRWVLRSNIPPNKAATYFSSEGHSILRQYFEGALPSRVEALLTNAQKRITEEHFSTENADTLLEDVSALFSQYHLSQNRLVSSYRDYFWQLVVILCAYQLSVLSLSHRMRARGLEDLRLAAEGFFNAVDLSLIAAFCTFFFQERNPLTYILFVAYVYHMVLFGATLGIHTESKNSPVAFYLALTYTLCILVPIVISALVLKSALFLLAGLISIPVSLAIGFALRRYGGLGWLAKYLTDEPVLTGP